MSKIDWLSERIIFGVLIIGGYFAVGGFMMYMSHYGIIDPKVYDLAHDMHLTVGPVIGIIVQSIWKTDKTERLQAQTNANLVDKIPPATPSTESGT